MRSPFDPDGAFLFSKPGSPPHVEPDGFAWRLDPGNELVLNVHLHPIGKAEEVRPSIALYFTDKPQTRFPLLVQLENDDALKHPARRPRLSRSLTISPCRWTRISWLPDLIPTRTIWASCSRLMRRCRAARANG